MVLKSDVSEFSAELRRELLDVVRAAVAERVAPRAAEIDREERFPDDIRKLWAELGLLGLSVPERFGGTGCPLRCSAEVVGEIAKVCANSANILTQQAFACSPLVLRGSDEQRARWLPDLASGRHLGAFALTEPEAGSDNQAMRTTARRDGDSYIVNGAKVFCTWGSIAQVLTVFARAADDPDGEGFVALVIDLPVEGLVVDRLEKKMGFHGSPTAQLTFEDVRVPVANRLGRPGDGLSIAMHTLNPGRVLIGALALGLAEGALEFAGRYLDERRQFGQRLSSFQGLRFKIADHAAEIEAARMLLQAAADAVDHGSDDVIQLSSMAKLFATEVAMRVTTDAVGLLGGYGYLTDYPVERLMREAKLTQIVEGTNEIQRVVIAKEWFRRLQGDHPGPLESDAGREN